MGSNNVLKRSGIKSAHLDPKARNKKTTVTIASTNTQATVLNEIPIAKVVIDFNVSLTSFNSAITYDDIILNIGDVAFLVAQTDPSENGLYVLQDVTTLVRLTGFISAQFMLVSVGAGSKYGGTIWQLQQGSLIGTDDLIFIRLTNEVLHSLITSTTIITSSTTDIAGTSIPVKKNQSYIMEGQFYLNIVSPVTLTNFQLKVSIPSGNINGYFFANSNTGSATDGMNKLGNSSLYDMTNFSASYTINNLYFLVVNWRAVVNIGSTAGNVLIQGISGTANSVRIQAVGYNSLTKVY